MPESSRELCRVPIIKLEWNPTSGALAIKERWSVNSKYSPYIIGIIEKWGIMSADLPLKKRHSCHNRMENGNFCSSPFLHQPVFHQKLWNYHCDYFGCLEWSMLAHILQILIGFAFLLTGCPCMCYLLTKKIFRKYTK